MAKEKMGVNVIRSPEIGHQDEQPFLEKIKAR